MTTAYQQARQEAGLSQEAAAAALHMDRTRLSRIETGAQDPSDEDALAMARVYGRPELCNYYCTHSCQIGRELFREVQPVGFDRAVLRLLGALEQMGSLRDALTRIAADGAVTREEQETLRQVLQSLEEFSDAALTLRLWARGQQG